MLLYIANCTQQVQDFVYRLPESPATRTQKIEIGGQIFISGDLTTLEIDEIVKQHRKYGLIPYDEIDRTKNFAGLCYSIGKPVPFERIVRVIKHNEGVLVTRGVEQRKEAAVAVNDLLERNTEGMDALNSLELSVVEEKRDPRDETPVIAEGIRVTRAVEPNRPKPSGRQRRARLNG